MIRTTWKQMKFHVKTEINSVATSTRQVNWVRKNPPGLDFIAKVLRYNKTNTLERPKAGTSVVTQWDKTYLTIERPKLKCYFAATNNRSMEVRHSIQITFWCYCCSGINKGKVNIKQSEWIENGAITTRNWAIVIPARKTVRTVFLSPSDNWHFVSRIE